MKNFINCKIKKIAMLSVALANVIVLSLSNITYTYAVEDTISVYKWINSSIGPFTDALEVTVPHQSVYNNLTGFEISIDNGPAVTQEKKALQNGRVRINLLEYNNGRGILSLTSTINIKAVDRNGNKTSVYNGRPNDTIITLPNNIASSHSLSDKIMSKSVPNMVDAMEFRLPKEIYDVISSYRVTLHGKQPVTVNKYPYKITNVLRHGTVRINILEYNNGMGVSESEITRIDAIDINGNFHVIYSK